MKLTNRARRQVDSLRRHYRRLAYTEALRNLSAALQRVPQLVADDRVLPAPRPYPDLAVPGEAWVHIAPYWFAVSLMEPPMIIAVFYDQADIPNRL